MIAKDQLKSIIDRAERLNQEKADIGENLKELFQEAKSNGFCTATLRTVIKMRAEDKDKRAARESLLEIYLEALSFNGTPLAMAAAARKELEAANA